LKYGLSNHRMSLLLPCLLLLLPCLFIAFLYTRQRERTRPIPDNQTQIDNKFYNDVDWWSVDSSLGTLQGITPIRVEYFHSVLQKYLPPKKNSQPSANQSRLLEIGCGAGFVTERLAQLGYTVVGIDLCSGAIFQAQQHALNSGSEISSHVEYCVGSATDLDFPSSSFDAVVAADVLEHIHDLPSAISEIHRVLKPGGLLLFDTINRTVWSYLVAILFLQELPFFHVVPRNTHAWSLFITPKEMDKLCTKYNLCLKEVKGICYKKNFKLFSGLLKQRIDAESTYLGKDISVSYIGYAVKE